MTDPLDLDAIERGSEYLTSVTKSDGWQRTVLALISEVRRLRSQQGVVCEGCDDVCVTHAVPLNHAESTARVKSTYSELVEWLRSHETPLKTHHNAKPDPDRCRLCAAASAIQTLAASAERVEGYERLQAEDIDNLTARAERAEAELDRACRWIGSALTVATWPPNCSLVDEAREFLSSQRDAEGTSGRNISRSRQEATSASTQGASVNLERPCSRCKGSGQLAITEVSGAPTRPWDVRTCPSCQGSGGER